MIDEAKILRKYVIITDTAAREALKDYKEYSYIVYFFNQEKEEMEIIMQYEGKNNNEIKENRINCYTCAHCTNAYKKIDKYISAVAKLYEKEGRIHVSEKACRSCRCSSSRSRGKVCLFDCFVLLNLRSFLRFYIDIQIL